MLRVLPVLALALAACGSPHPASHGGGGNGGSAPPAEICDDRQDNDGNGLVDCADPACASAPSCPACGDGFLDSREACDGENLNGASCKSLGFNGGGLLACSPTCALDTSGCLRHEDCETPGDEDKNGLSDCEDPVCTLRPNCLTLTALDPPPAPRVLSTVVLGFRLDDGAGKPLGGRILDLNLSGTTTSAAAPAISGADGVALFTVRLGPSASPQDFTAILSGTNVNATVMVAPVDLAPGTIVTVLDADRAAGTDDSGPAVDAHVGAPFGVQVSSAGVVYVAEACRVLTIAPDGILTRLAGTGTCGIAPADETFPLQADLTVSGIALDEPRKVLYIADGGAGLVRAIDLAFDRMSTVAGGGKLVASLGPTSVAVGASGRVIVRDGLTKTFLAISADGSAIAPAMGPWGPACCTGDCQIAFDSAGTPFAAGTFCVPTGAGSQVTPGVARYDAAGTYSLIAGKIPGLAPAGIPAELAQLPDVTASAFDQGGNLYVLVGNSLFRVDGTTSVIRKLAGGPAGFGGEGGQYGAALFSGPSALAFGPGGDLYVADTGNGVLRRIVGLGAASPTPATVQVVSGDGQSAMLAQKPDAPLIFAALDGDGHALARQQPVMVVSQPGVFVSEAPRTDDAGQSQVNVRMGLKPGTITIRAYLSGIHAAPSGTPAVFTLRALEPAPGTVFQVIAGDGPAPTAGKPVPATSAPMGAYDILVGPDGSIFLNAGAQVLKLDSEGMLSLLGGNGIYTSSGTSGPAVDASFYPTALALDAGANLLHVADAGMVRTIDLSTGLLSLLAGPGTGRDGDGDGGPALDATFGSIIAMVLEDSGAIDLGSYSSGVRRIDPATGIISLLVPQERPCTTNVHGLDYGLDSMGEVGQALWFDNVDCYDGSLSLIRRDPDGSLTYFSRTYASAIAPAPDGSLTLGGYEQVDRFDPATGKVTVLLDHGLSNNVFGLAYDADGHLWIADGYLKVMW